MNIIQHFVSCFLLVVSPALLFGQINQDFQNGTLSGVNAVVIRDPGRREGIVWDQTVADWSVDVAPPGRNGTLSTGQDGDLHLYGVANSIRAWRPLIIRGNETQVKLQIANIDPSGYTAIRMGEDEIGNDQSALYRFNSSWSHSVPLWEANSLVLWEATGATNLGGKLNVKFFTGTTSDERMRITDTGRVGIGTESPNFFLDAKAPIDEFAIVRINTDASSTKKDNWVYHSVGDELKSALGYRHSTDALSLYHYGQDRLIINSSGDIGIGTTTPSSKLTVDGLITSEEIKVQDVTGADFVFAEDYVLPTLSEVENHIKQYQHLPEIPSAQEMQQQGIQLGEMNIKLLQKIEELTLYLIEQDKTIQTLQQKVALLEARY